MTTTSRRTIGNTAVAVGSPWLFFAVSVGATWLFWLSAIAFGLRFDSAAGILLLLAGLAAPGVAGIGFVYLVYGTRGRADFWARITEVRRIGVRWFAIILLLPVAVTLVAAAVDLLLGGSGLVWGEGVSEFGTNPAAILPALFFVTLPPILEELGWRGYALDRLQLHWSALGASLILGVVWSLWHLPLFFIPGSFQHDMVGFGTIGFWLFTIGIVSLSPAFTWVYNHTARSILGIILLHGWVNFTAETLEVADPAYYLHWILLAVVLTVIWGPKTLTRADDVPHPPTDSER
ncbi:type II CAAX endopeptidase family protein [Natronorubrum texcoconense]|uniref:CAAX protease self-immunity n=1 Tax=Natronorubrum texcoconense TaxID=1095776 RepID=A0A1G8UJK3_9EURY|nr:type II CAAX endopeptidase family protein [Natronorubrum texcoconense]SDJ53774.1 CAAX protease self-immunity [Natronorubrum texcoconense]